MVRVYFGLGRKLCFCDSRSETGRPVDLQTRFMLNTGLRLGQSDGLVQGYYTRDTFVFNEIRTLSGFGFTAAAVVAAKMCYHLSRLVVCLIIFEVQYMIN